MPTLGELKAQMRKEGVTDTAERNRRIADLVKSRSPRMTDVDVERTRQGPPGQRMTDVDVERRRSAPAGGMQPRVGSPTRERLTDVDVERMRNQPVTTPQVPPGRMTDMDIERQRQAAPLVLPTLNVPGTEPQELTDEQVAGILYEPLEPELTDEEVRQRITPLPEEQAQSAFMNVLQQMSDQYRNIPQYREILDQEEVQLEDQISQLMQRRNMIKIAKQGGGNG